MKFHPSFLLLLIPHFVNSVEDSRPRTVDGHVVSPGSEEAGFHLSLGMPVANGVRVFCGGTLLSEQ